MVRPCCQQGRFVKPEAARTNQGGSSFRCQANPQSTFKGSHKQIGGSNAAGFQLGQTKPRFIWPQPSDGKRQEVQLIQLQSVKCYTCILVKRHSKGPFPVFYIPGAEGSQQVRMYGSSPQFNQISNQCKIQKPKKDTGQTSFQPKLKSTLVVLYLKQTLFAILIAKTVHSRMGKGLVQIFTLLSIKRACWRGRWQGRDMPRQCASNRA